MNIHPHRARVPGRGALTLLAAALGGACDNAQQQALIDAYRAAEFGSSQSSLSRGQVILTTSFHMGRAYDVTGKRIEFARVESGADAPIDDRGELRGFRLVNADLEQSAAADSTAADPVGRPPRRSTLTVRIPFRTVRSGEVYYRWVLEYSSRDGQRVSLRKSPIYRIDAQIARASGDDPRASP